MSKPEEMNEKTLQAEAQTVSLRFAIPPELYNQLKRYADVESKSISAIIEQGLACFVAHTNEAETSTYQNQDIYTSEHYAELLEIHPNNYKAWYSRGVLLKNLGRYEEAVATLDKALEIKPDDHKAWYARGNALYGLDFYEEAIASYNKAIELKPDYTEALYYRDKAFRRNNISR
ncbi:MAG: tetratricopeptide repeat protein [Scytonema sp. PMC 1069.18]|nr:tetratricopeptide repeat protein [Scytonema sp. PMC 1069.18]MEC4881037.1 tetratricopeptide repeat protein [Scytonema sp. PMC 1070.18]